MNCVKPGAKASDYHVGQTVRYVPSHAVAQRGADAWQHPDCEDGVVNSLRGDSVFVLFKNRDGTWQTTVKGCTPHDLLNWEDD